jgi:hypothetical protein
VERSRLYRILRLGFLRTANPTDEQLRELQDLLETLPIEISLRGLKFARHRWLRERYGTKKLGGRPSKVKFETSSLTVKEARERLENWKWWIKHYFEKGYKRRTITNIKKELIRQSQQAD